MKKNIWTLAVAVLLVAVLAIYTFCYTVQAGTVGLVYTLGAVSDVRTDPGIGLKWPWPFQTVKPLDTRVRVFTVPGKMVSTQDQFNVLLTLSVGWRVAPTPEAAKQFINAFETVEKAREDLDSRVASARQTQIQTVRLDAFISPDPEQEKRYAAFEERIRKTVQEGLDADQLGINLAFLKIERVAFPGDTTQEVFNRMIKERETQSENLIQEGEQLAKKIRQEAKLEKNKMLNEARADAKRIQGEGDAEAAKHYKIFAENPELATFLRRLDALKTVLEKRSTVVLPADNPLDSLVEPPPDLPGRKSR